MRWLPLVLLAAAVLTLLADGVGWWLRIAVAALLTVAAVSLFMRRHGLSWGGLFGGFRRDH